MVQTPVRWCRPLNLKIIPNRGQFICYLRYATVPVEFGKNGFLLILTAWLQFKLNWLTSIGNMGAWGLMPQKYWSCFQIEHFKSLSLAEWQDLLVKTINVEKPDREKFLRKADLYLIFIYNIIEIDKRKWPQLTDLLYYNIILDSTDKTIKPTTAPKRLMKLETSDQRSWVRSSITKAMIKKQQLLNMYDSTSKQSFIATIVYLDRICRNVAWHRLDDRCNLLTLFCVALDSESMIHIVIRCRPAARLSPRKWNDWPF